MLYASIMGEEPLILIMGTFTLLGLALNCWLKYMDRPGGKR